MINRVARCYSPAPWLPGIVAACTLLNAPASHAQLQPGYATVDAIHADICLPYIGNTPGQADGQWQAFIHTGNSGFTNGQPNFVNYATNQVALQVNASSYFPERPANGFNNFDFTGVAAGQPIWVLDQNPIPGQLYLGVEADASFDGLTRMLPNNTTNWGNWDPDGAGTRTNASRWVQLSLVGFRGPGSFAAWDYGNSDGSARVWMATADGVNSTQDFFAQIPRSHSHYNWSFSAPGQYELDLQATTRLPDGTILTSPATTVYFQVQAAAPEPTSLALGLLALFPFGLGVCRARKTALIR